MNEKDSRVQSVEWDSDWCATCGKNTSATCMNNFCTFTDTAFGDTTCGNARDKDKKEDACGLILYLGWKGPAHAGFATQYLKSYRNLPSHYTKYSKDEQYINAAGDIPPKNWFNF